MEPPGYKGRSENCARSVQPIHSQLGFSINQQFPFISVAVISSYSSITLLKINYNIEILYDHLFLEVFISIIWKFLFDCLERFKPFICYIFFVENVRPDPYLRIIDYELILYLLLVPGRSLNSNGLMYFYFIRLFNSVNYFLKYYSRFFISNESLW